MFGKKEDLEIVGHDLCLIGENVMEGRFDGGENTRGGHDFCMELW